MVHAVLHVLVPCLLALAFYRSRWRTVLGVWLATLAVDLDHLLANPIYDPERCSIGFHPLHTAPAIAVYAILCAAPWLHGALGRPWPSKHVAALHWIGGGLLIHMALDALDCWI